MYGRGRLYTLHVQNHVILEPAPQSDIAIILDNVNYFISMALYSDDNLAACSHACIAMFLLAVAFELRVVVV